MKIAVISVTQNGRKLSGIIAKQLSGEEIKRYCFYKYTDENAVDFRSVYSLTGEIFREYQALVFVCACGIAVRAIAPHIKSKTSDPAVIVIDDCGKFVVPILSGHIGGANRLAEILAKKINAVSVITTATDTGKKFSPDCFAMSNNLIISDMNAAKEIAAAVLNGEKIGFSSDYRYDELPPELSENPDCRTGIYTGTEDINPFEITLKLIPKNIVLGIGCKKNTLCETIEKRVRETLENAQIPLERICTVSTADIKAHEMGMLQFCRKINVPLVTFSAAELMSIDGDFTGSEFVRKITGADNICERSAVLCGGTLILRKNAAEGVTIAAAEKNIEIKF